MFGIGKKRVNIESYKGVRDFYPADKSLQNYIFAKMRKVAESFGYEEYDASLLEPLELYKSKSSDEILSEQIYSFEDRGGRQVALRPEMTPTVSRMIAARFQELPVPIRWYSIPNIFRYEKPQRGRLREHWQLNLDMFGVFGPESDTEVISIAYKILRDFGAENKDFVIKINSRALMDRLFKGIGVDDDRVMFLYRLLDKKEKMTESEFKKASISLLNEDVASKLFESLYIEEGVLTSMIQTEEAKYLSQVMSNLREIGITNILFTPTLTRGFDYYTGVVFEVFDTNKENPRSLFGGGRYDKLVGSFSGVDMPAFGFGMGDVTIKDFIETHKLNPEIKSSVALYIAVAPETDHLEVMKIADKFRENNINTAVDISGKKLSDQLKSLDKRNISFVFILGPEEIKNQNFVLRNTKTREEKRASLNEIIDFLVKGNLK